jgi:hypothetical protein
MIEISEIMTAISNLDFVFSIGRNNENIDDRRIQRLDM